MFDFGANQSGETARFAKPLYGLKPYQGFESLPLRQIILSNHPGPPVFRLAFRSIFLLRGLRSIAACGASPRRGVG